MIPSMDDDALSEEGGPLLFGRVLDGKGGARVIGLCGAILAMQLVLFWRWKWF